MKRLLIDFDDVICESVWLKEINYFLGTKYKITHFKDYLIDPIIPEDKQKEFYEKISRTNLYDNAKLIKGAKEALKKLNEVYDIYICSSCVMAMEPLMSGPHFTSKFNFLIKKLPFLDPRKFVFTSSKDVVCGDILIDDYLGNLERSPAKRKILFASYHNKHFTEEELKQKNVERIDGWEEVCKVLL